MTFRRGLERRPGEARGKSPEIGQQGLPPGKKPRAPALPNHSRTLQSHHRQNKQGHERFPGAALRQQPLEPHADHAVEYHVHRRKDSDDERCCREKFGTGKPNPAQQAQAPKERPQRCGISECIGHAEDVKRGQAQRKAQQAPEIKLHGERRHHHRKEMPGEKNSPEKKAEQIQAILCRNEIGAHGDARARTENEQGGEQTGDDKTNQLERRVALPQPAPEDRPAKPGDEQDLRGEACGAGYISHDSSSIGRRPPSSPTMETKICSRVSFSPSAGASRRDSAEDAATPARSSSSEPWATSRPLWMMATWLHKRSTISSTCEVRKIVTPRAVMRWSIAFNAPAASASTPSNGSSRNKILGP